MRIVFVSWIPVEVEVPPRREEENENRTEEVQPRRQEENESRVEENQMERTNDSESELTDQEEPEVVYVHRIWREPAFQRRGQEEQMNESRMEENQMERTNESQPEEVRSTQPEKMKDENVRKEAEPETGSGPSTVADSEQVDSTVHPPAVDGDNEDAQN
ncbi:hypothetical protein K435DRAFT_843839 [Dendrothele bispora CBS 962.96]|uniref:Uncharacterized protein n=1 Tax=Dendrothele bispora (strain CBS 962.96) TaxID=1314807 RepID=A0A4S8L695_DENBC|nr:hypothetical protein K435DRAFT_843839 [Dendrothele bispora CBS 962.96]